MNELPTAAKIYASYMASIKLRIGEIEKLAANDGRLAEVVVQDCLALQLRFVLEAIYQSCIAAQFDHPENTNSSKIKEWNPKVIRGMFKGRPAFFPAALTVDPDGGGVRSVVGDVLSELEVYAMYGYCGDILHHKSLYKGSPFKTHYTEGFWVRYEAFVQRLISLLAYHSNFVLQPDGSAVIFMCEMGWPEEKLAPRVIRGQSVGQMQFIPEDKSR